MTFCTDCGRLPDEFGMYTNQDGKPLCWQCWLGHDGDLVLVDYGAGSAWLRAEERKAAA